MKTDLTGRVAIVTAAAQGLGEASARVMASRGATVVLADINEAGAKAAAEAIAAAGGKASAMHMDACDEDSIRALVDTTFDAHGRLDILHNNAGGSDMTRDYQATSMTNETWRWIFAYNMDSIHWGCKYAIPHMIAGGRGGAIVNTVSGAAMIAMSARIAYGSAKAAADSYTRYIAVQYGPDNIRCNAIAPGLILTKHAREVLPQETLELLNKHSPLPRYGEPDDIGELAAFLVSDAAGYINGQTIRVDGGSGVRSSHDADNPETKGGR